MLAKFKKSLSVLILAGVLFTQTGCIAGLVTGMNALYISGIVVGLSAQFVCQTEKCAKIFGYASAILDDKNPGRQDALNPLPIDSAIAQKLDVTVGHLAQYNEELSSVLKANDYLETQLAILSSGKMTGLDLHQASRDLGFSSGEELANILAQDALTTEQLAQFAQMQSLSAETAKLFLQLRFGIKTI